MKVSYNLMAVGVSGGLEVNCILGTDGVRSA